MNQIFIVARFTVASAFKLGYPQAMGILLAALVLILFNNIAVQDNPLYFAQVFATYSLHLSCAALTLGAIGLGCYLLRSVIERRRFHLLFSKPVARGRILIGTGMGVSALSLALLACCGGLILGLVERHVSKNPAAFAPDSPGEVFVASYAQIHPEHARQESDGHARSLEVHATRTWTYTPGPREKTLEKPVFSFQFVSSTPNTLEPVDFDYTIQANGIGLDSGRIAGYPHKPVEIPADVLSGKASAQKISLTLTNRSQHNRTLFFNGEAVLRHRNLSFGANFLRLLLLEGIKTVFLIHAALCFSSFLSFLVAFPAAVVYLIVSSASESLRFLAGRAQLFNVGHHGEAPDPTFLDYAFKGILKFLLLVSGRAGEIPAVSMLVHGQTIAFGPQTLSLLGLWLLYAAAFCALGAWLFTKTEASKLER